jgi:hypothetical protein
MSCRLRTRSPTAQILGPTHLCVATTLQNMAGVYRAQAPPSEPHTSPRARSLGLCPLTHTHSRTRTRAHARARTHTHTHARTRARTLTHTHTRTRTRAHSHTYASANALRCTRRRHCHRSAHACPRHFRLHCTCMPTPLPTSCDARSIHSIAIALPTAGPTRSRCLRCALAC